jgi:hypothetical protein
MAVKITEAIGWLLFVFLLGACLTLGTKTVNYLWPDVEHEIIVKHQYEISNKK